MRVCDLHCHVCIAFTQIYTQYSVVAFKMMHLNWLCSNWIDYFSTYVDTQRIYTSQFLNERSIRVFDVL